MHYNEIFLVKALSKENAVALTEAFLEKFYEHEWDWYQIGGRWLWSTLEKDYLDKIVKPGENCYWNPYWDSEVKGKTVEVKFPDGTTVTTSYGGNVEYAIQHWVHLHPFDSEVIDGCNENFYKILESREPSRQASIKEYQNSLRGYQEKGDKSMANYCKRQIRQLKYNTKWCNEHHFWNITDNTFKAPPNEEFLKNAKHWFLVNIDIHN